MFNKCQTILATRPAAVVLALILFAGFTAPFVMLQHAYAAPDPPPCTEGNHNGCTELSPVPPEDPQAVPPNVVLMLDDSGSMAWDFMPDWGDLSNTSVYGTRNSGINYVYYNPLTTYTPPPKATATGTTWQADGTWYPNSPSMIGAYTDGFTPTATTNIVGGSGYVGGGNGNTFNYTDSLQTTLFTTPSAPVDKGPAVWGGGTPGSPGSPGSPGGGCISGYSVDPSNPAQCIRAPVSPTHSWTCNSGDGSAYSSGGVMMCHHKVWEEGIQVDHPYAANDGGLVCPAGTTGPDTGGLCDYPPIGTIPPTPPTPPTDPTPNYKWVCPSGSSYSGSPAPYPAAAPECWTPAGSSSRISVRAFTYVVGNPVQTNSHYVIPNVAFNGQDPPAGGWCSVLYTAWQKTNCTDADDTTGRAAPAGVSADQNVANWFSYYRTRLLMAKSSLMTSFSGVDPKYRFGFSSINGNGTSNIPTSPTPFTFDDSTAVGALNAGGNTNNKLAVVQPFGDGTTGTQKAKFWTWLASVSAAKGTPLRKALQAAGDYYKTDQPWSAMSGDPGYTTGSTTKFACRASYTILTTDGFWNGSDPSGIGAAANVDGPTQTVPAGAVTGYFATSPSPYPGGGVGGDVASLADVATYYWENDLNTDLPNEVATSTADPASWQHMSTFTVGLGYPPVGITPSTTTVSQILAWARGGAAITGFSWPTPASDSLNNIADLAHAAVNGHGDFFNANNPQQLATAFANAIADIGARAVPPTPASVNASVLSIGALTFSTGYNTGDWSGAFEAVSLNTDGTTGSVLWDAGALLNTAYHSSGYATRKVYTGAYTVSGTGGTYTGFQFTAANKASLDSTETAGLQTPALAGGDDTLDNRINYLLGDNTYEGTSTGTTYRSRNTSILGAILRSDPVYVNGASGNYPDRWTQIGSATPPESSSTAEPYSTFVVDQSTRAGMVYVGANDGMLHAFHAPVPTCAGTIDSDGNCPSYTSPTGSGTEAWAFVPRAVYANLGNLTDAVNFQFLPTVDATPVTRDVFSAPANGGDNQWHTLLTGGVGMGGRGVYALDITNPSSFAASNVLWEFDADMPADAACVATYESCRSTDLGYTLSQPNIGRLANGEWVVLVPNGYFPDCSTPDMPTKDAATCEAIAAQAPKDVSGNPYSALFVLDAITGKMVAELKTPTNITGVTSFGLAPPVLGDYNGDRIDDIAFAGDVQGNLWRFDLSSTNPSDWSVTLVYQGTSSGGHQGVQPITTMPRLFPDPVTNRFIVVFGTGKYLGFGDNSDTNQQAIYGIRDVSGTTYTQADLTQQFLHEWVVPAGEANAGATLRCVTGSASDGCTSTATPINTLPTTGGGWYINLATTDSGGTLTDSGERVVVSPAAIFVSNAVVFQSLITGALNSDPCSPSTQGALMVLSAASGGPGSVSTLGSWPTAGGRITNARTHGSLPAVSTAGGGQILFPSGQLSDGTTMGADTSITRRRSWRILLNDQ